jgi:HAD superfamily 5'-nucleotidase-like hydrolase
LPILQDEESSEPDLVNEIEASQHILHDDSMTVLPRHSTHEGVNVILETTEHVMAALHVQSLELQQEQSLLNTNEMSVDTDEPDVEDPMSNSHERVFANSYVDLGKVSTVGFDYDYTLVTYNQELLELIYNMALKRLVTDNQYPMEMLDSGLKFDPRFSIRGLAVDRKTGWICHLSYTHKVAVAWEGRNKVSSSRLVSEYSGKRAMRPQERKKRLKPLNDLFSMAECCLIADTVQFFKTRNIPFYPPNVVNDVLKSVGSTHISGDFHRLVAKNPKKYFHPTPHLRQVLDTLKASGKRLIFVSNSPFWYVDAGMTHVIGPNWRDTWDVGTCM